MRFHRRRNIYLAWALSLFLVFHLVMCQEQENRPLWIPWRTNNQKRRNSNFPTSSYQYQQHQPVWLNYQYSNNHQPLNYEEDAAQDRIDIVDVNHDDGENEVQDVVPTLNVSQEDSPYALIDKYFPEREVQHKRMANDFERKYYNGQATKEQIIGIGSVDPKDVWLSDGDLLVLKGGSTPNRNGIDNPWEPLDDYQAPYREPKLPPPDFVPQEHGVGVPLPNIDEYEDDEEDYRINNVNVGLEDDLLINSVGDSGKKFNEENYITQMENFHAIRHQVVSDTPNIPTSTDPPSYLFTVTSPDSYAFSYLSPTQSPSATTPRTTPAPQTRPNTTRPTTPTPNPYVVTTYRSSYGHLQPFSQQQQSDSINKLQEVIHLTTPSPLRRSTEHIPQSNTEPAVVNNSISDDDVEEKQPFEKRKQPFLNKTRFRHSYPPISNYNRRKARQRRLFPVPPKPTDVRSLPHVNGLGQLHVLHQPSRQFQSPSEIFAKVIDRSSSGNKSSFYHRKPNLLRRTGLSDKSLSARTGELKRKKKQKYVSFFRGTVGGKSWSYSYNL